MLGKAQPSGAKIPVAVRQGEEGNPPKFPLLFHKTSPWKPCMKHHVKSCLIIFSELDLLAHGSSTSTHTHHGQANGSSGGHVAGGLEGPLINEYAHWHTQGLVSIPSAGNPDLGSCSGLVGCSADSLHSLWAQRCCLPVTHPSSPTGPTLLALLALPFLGCSWCLSPSRKRARTV